MCARITSLTHGGSATGGGFECTLHQRVSKLRVEMVVRFGFHLRVHHR